MFEVVNLSVFERRPQGWGKRRRVLRAEVAIDPRTTKPKRGGPAHPKKEARRRVRGHAAPHLPEGWGLRLREQSNNLARAVEMLEQALAMIDEPRSHALARAQSLRGAGLITLMAAAELLVVAGWFESDQVVGGGTLDAKRDKERGE